MCPEGAPDLVRTDHQATNVHKTTPFWRHFQGALALNNYPGLKPWAKFLLPLRGVRSVDSLSECLWAAADRYRACREAESNIIPEVLAQRIPNDQPTVFVRTTSSIPTPQHGCNSDLAQYSNTPARNASRNDAGGPTLHHSDLASNLWTGVESVCPGGTPRTLSRRDRMIAARQFIAWNTPKKGEPSRRGGVSRAARHIHRPWSKNVLSAESYRSLRDGFFVSHTPGNKLPGYDHSVPPGQQTLPDNCPQNRSHPTPRGRIRGRVRSAL